MNWAGQLQAWAITHLESLDLIFLADEDQTYHNGDNDNYNPSEEAIEEVC